MQRIREVSATRQKWWDEQKKLHPLMRLEPADSLQAQIDALRQAVTARTELLRSIYEEIMGFKESWNRAIATRFEGLARQATLTDILNRIAVVEGNQHKLEQAQQNKALGGKQRRRKAKSRKTS